MQYLPGQSLQERIDLGICSTSEIGGELWSWARNLVSALLVCHLVDGVYHKDIKPDNCVLNEKNELVLIDFGDSTRFSIDT